MLIMLIRTYEYLLMSGAIILLLFVATYASANANIGGNDLFSQFFPQKAVVPSVSNANWLKANDTRTSGTSRRGALVFVYHLSKGCIDVFPSYIVSSLLQAIRSQPHLDVILLSNFADCRVIFETVKHIPSLHLVDTTKSRSHLTMEFESLADSFFFRDEKLAFLWKSSASRFFHLRDFMTAYHYDEILHIEADNLLYYPFSEELFDVMRRSYPMAAVPLLANKAFVSGSIFWVSRLQYLVDLTDYFMQIVRKQDPVWAPYLSFLKRWFCCKNGGFEPDPETGRGVKPFGVNEMSMLAFYRTLHPEILKTLPVLPSYPSYPRKRSFLDLSQYTSGGKEVGPATLHLLWDAGPYGQYVGGTWMKKGQDIGGFDLAHVVGQAIALAQCTVKFLCVKNSTFYREIDPQLFSPLNPALASLSEVCYSAPFVRCGASTTTSANSSPWIPLMNLHVHSKRLSSHASSSCPCQ